MRKLLLTILFSTSALAGYECDIKLFPVETPENLVAETRVSIGENEIKSGHIGTLFVEEHIEPKTSLELGAFMNGWKADEEVSFYVSRKIALKNKPEGEIISERFSLRGNNKMTVWFDSYKLSASCKVI